ncbi:MAG: helix-turn-helix transcriptional regulator [Chloroflexi bacterium]|uniref:winged helix-turn-helix transcriptional regulator n=1 Tax=Candidatus Flexifilum breve TaxID=3140694 RepID=UPI003136D965|nr:helix-turn-helix transcriptional regulator [Chloroflexota bacterium]
MLAEAPRTFDAYAEICPTRAALDRIADKWTVLVVGVLLDGQPQRFSAIQRRIEGISQKMLTKTLRTLERDGLVERHIYPEVPPRVEYQLTALGKSLSTLINAVQAWAESHMEDILAAQALYDQRGEPVDE